MSRELGGCLKEVGSSVALKKALQQAGYRHGDTFHGATLLEHLCWGWLLTGTGLAPMDQWRTLKAALQLAAPSLAAPLPRLAVAQWFMESSASANSSWKMQYVSAIDFFSKLVEQHTSHLPRHFRSPTPDLVSMFEPQWPSERYLRTALPGWRENLHGHCVDKLARKMWRAAMARESVFQTGAFFHSHAGQASPFKRFCEKATQTRCFQDGWLIARSELWKEVMAGAAAQNMLEREFGDGKWLVGIVLEEGAIQGPLWHAFRRHMSTLSLQHQVEWATEFKTFMAMKDLGSIEGFEERFAPLLSGIEKADLEMSVPAVSSSAKGHRL